MCVCVYICVNVLLLNEVVYTNRHSVPLYHIEPSTELTFLWFLSIYKK